MNVSKAATIGVLVGLAAVTVYDAAVALGLIAPGSLPGEGPPGSETVGVAAAVGLSSAAILAGTLSRLSAPTRLAALLAPAAAAFLVVHFYTFDSYYLPTMIRYSQRDFVPAAFVFSVAGLAIAAGVVARVRPSTGLALSAPLILVCGLTALFAGVGH